MKNLRFFFGGIIFILMIIMIFFFYSKINNHKKEGLLYEEQYWNQCDIEFCGIVSNIELIDHGYGYLCLDIIGTNKHDGYELFINDEVFVCHLKNNKLVFVGEATQVKIGDKICYNIAGNKKEVRYRNDSIYVSFDNRFIRKTFHKYMPNKATCH